MLDTQWTAELTAAQSAAVRELLRAAAAADGWPPTDPLPPELQGGPHLLGHDNGELAGYALLDEGGDAFGRQVAELIVHPDRRRRGHGGRMLAAVQARSRTTLRVWSHTDHPAAAALARATGFARVRELLRMAADLRTAEPPAAQLPPGVRLRTFRPGVDEQALVDVNARAFAWHPEQGAMTVADVRAAEAEAWFDPAGFFLAETTDGKLLGFHWTKVHPDTSGNQTGEVYVVGVDPDAHGGGLGKALTAAGLEYLHKRSLNRVILYVEGDNAPAITVYRRYGFHVESTAVQYERQSGDTQHG